ncbi:MAG: hypothetical protein OWU84_12345 [Firmicutes bacterium]|nr:hypothetical protein [Bacillota bacterium]
MRRRWPKTSLLFFGTVGLSLLLGLTVWLMPPIIPAPDTVSASPLPHASRHAAQARAVSPVGATTAPVSSSTFLPVDYEPFLGSLRSEARALGITLVLPQSSYAGTALEENYVSGQVLVLVFNNMLVMESKEPMVSYYLPASTLSVSLAAGGTGTWEWIPGEGGPPYRLNFALDGTYVQIRLFSPPLADTVATAVRIANAFTPVGSR